MKRALKRLFDIVFQTNDYWNQLEKETEIECNEIAIKFWNDNRTIINKN